MPHILTHILYGKQLMVQHDKEIRDTQLERIFQLGTQGPDFFFYHRFLPWVKEKPGTVVGERIHKERCGPFLMAMIDYVKKQGNLDPSLVYYVTGFLTHHLLDRNAHPYIFYKSGLDTKKHQRFELIIDTLMWEKWQGEQTWKIPVYQKIDAGSQLPEKIVAMYASVFKQVFPGQEDRFDVAWVDQSYQDMKKALRLLYDPYGIKNVVSGGYISAYIHQKRFDRSVDYMNEQRAPWSHPSCEEEIEQTSFEDIFERALQEGKQVLQHLFRYWELGDEKEREQLKQCIGNLSYDLGKDCDRDWEMKHFQVVI